MGAKFGIIVSRKEDDPEMVLLQVRIASFTATAMYILHLWSLTDYPFLNHHSIVIGLTCLRIFMALFVSRIDSQIHRDEILRRTTETEVGKLGFRLAFPVGVDYWSAVIDADHVTVSRT